MEKTTVLLISLSRQKPGDGSSTIMKYACRPWENKSRKQANRGTRSSRKSLRTERGKTIDEVCVLGPLTAEERTRKEREVRGQAVEAPMSLQMHAVQHNLCFSDECMDEISHEPAGALGMFD